MATAGALLQSINPKYQYSEDHELVVDTLAKPGSVRLLFSEGRATLTLVVWTIAFSSYFGFYMLSTWLPTIFTKLNWPQALALQTVAIFTIGSIFGGVAFGWLMDRSRTFLVLGLGYLTAAALTFAIGSVNLPIPQVATLVVLAGVAYGGAQLSLVAVISNIYPTASRATGVGWALSVARLGSVVSPTVAGVAISAGWKTSALFGIAAAPAAVAGLCALLINMKPLTSAKEGEPAA